jgi:hypothetical protein
LVARRRVSPDRESAKATENVEELLSPYLPAAIQAWVDGLKATKIIWIKGEVVDTGIADDIVRSNCAQKIVEYLIGKAIERSMQVTGSYQELSDLVTQLEESPEAHRLLPPELWNSLRRASSAESAPGATEGKTIPDSSQNSG